MFAQITRTGEFERAASALENPPDRRISRDGRGQRSSR